MENAKLHDCLIPQLLDITFVADYVHQEIPPLKEDYRNYIFNLKPILNFHEMMLLRKQIIPLVYISHDMEDYIRHLLVGIREQPFYGGGINETCFTDLEMACK
jgi:hypothetical protein